MRGRLILWRPVVAPGPKPGPTRRPQASWLLRTDLPYRAFDAGSGRLVGSIVLHRTDCNLPKTEAGCPIRSSERGKGAASEGVLTLTAWALDALGAQRVEPSDLRSCWSRTPLTIPGRARKGANESRRSP